MNYSDDTYDQHKRDLEDAAANMAAARHLLARAVYDASQDGMPLRVIGEHAGVSAMTARAYCLGIETGIELRRQTHRRTDAK